MRVLLFFSILFAGQSALAGPDYGKRLGICQKIYALPKDAATFDDCDKLNPVKSCDFALSKDSFPINYSVENGVIVKKTISFLDKDNPPFGITRYTSPKSAILKLRKLGLKIYVHDKSERYIQTADIKCDSNQYAIYVIYSKKQIIENIIISTLPYN